MSFVDNIDTPRFAIVVFALWPTVFIGSALGE